MMELVKKIQDAIVQIERCDFECEAGPLSLNVGFMKLKVAAGCLALLTANGGEHD